MTREMKAKRMSDEQLREEITLGKEAIGEWQSEESYQRALLEYTEARIYKAQREIAGWTGIIDVCENELKGRDSE